MAILSSASDLSATVSGDDVALSWTYPDDHVALGVAFDVYASDDALDLFQRRLASGVSTLSAALAGVPLAGTVYLTVVARGGDRLSLPAKAIAVTITPPSPALPAAEAGPGAGPPPSGLGFPFQITPLGGVYAQGGDPLLRGKILQLLLTSPGERVNLPDYGTRLVDLIFDPNSDVLAATTEFMVGRALQKYFADEIRVDGVSIENRGAEISIDIVYLKKSDLQMQRVRAFVPLP